MAAKKKPIAEVAPGRPRRSTRTRWARRARWSSCVGVKSPSSGARRADPVRATRRRRRRRWSRSCATKRGSSRDSDGDTQGLGGPAAARRRAVSASRARRWRRRSSSRRSSTRASTRWCSARTCAPLARGARRSRRRSSACSSPTTHSSPPTRPAPTWRRWHRRSASEAPAYVLFPHTYQSVEYFPRLAQQVDGAIVTAVAASASPTAPCCGRGRCSAASCRPTCASRRQRHGAGARQHPAGRGLCRSPASAAAGTVEALSTTALDALEPDREILGVESAAKDEVDLSKAEIIVAAGRGVGGADKMGVIQELGARARRRDRAPAGR